jgi:hypothetical protein
MLEGELIKQIKTLSEIKPDQAWKEQNRELLFSQIFNSASNETTERKPFALKSIFEYIDVMFFSRLGWVLSMPALTVLLILSAFFGTSFYSYRIAKNTKPGDSLYIAKIVSEKTQLALTFNETEKAKLGVSFASNRTQEMAKIMEGENTQDKDKHAEQLTEEFKNEIKTTKNRLEKIAQVQVAGETNTSTMRSIISKVSGGGSDQKSKPETKEVDNEVFSANTAKDGSKIELSDPADKKTDKPATTTPEEASSPEAILEQAEKLFDEKNYDGAIDKLNEANEVISKDQSAGNPDFKEAVTGSTSEENK